MSGWKGKTTTDLNLRAGTGLDYPILTTLPEGTVFDILDEVGSNWLHIRVGGQEGYVYRSYTQLPRAGKTAMALAVRNTPGETLPIVTALYEDTQLLVFGEEGGWYEVIALGMGGYVPVEAVLFPQIGKTTDTVNLRASASTESKILEILPPGTQVHIWRSEDGWLYVADTVRSGYLHSSYVQVGIEPVEEQPGKKPEPFPEVPLEPPEAEKIRLGPNPTYTERQVASLWNRMGGLLKALAAHLELDPAAAVAVLTVESGGRAFDANGRMIIRFENHVFYDRWGKDNLSIYQQHFQFNATQRWQDHMWRPAAHEAWRKAHTSQDEEWRVFEFARGLNDTAAKLSISMGGAQIMGFNYPTLGYDTVQQMFDAFSASERDQIIGFFNFLRGRATESKRIAALQALDFVTFARLYNGPGQAVQYGAAIRTAYDTFSRLRQT
ncbi:MAG: N-acetylmuramidase domain-containing protein [Anaerolineae bacterium]